MRNSKTLKKLAAIAITVTIAFSGCNKPYDTVFSTWPNGGKKLVFTVVDKKDGRVDRIGEKMYYENGRQMYEKHFDGDRPTGEWRFWYDNGQLHSKGNFNSNDSIGSDWVFYDSEGKDYYEGRYDSMAVLQFTADHRPLSIAFYHDNMETRFQFNENFTINTRGNLRDGLKEGRWEFFYANGQKMLEANYSGGVENGAYNSYRETGIPYFRGFYINGKRANVWEIYDEEGNLVARQDYDKH